MAYSWNTGASIPKPPMMKKTTTTPTTTSPVPTPTNTTVPKPPSTSSVPAQGYLGTMNNVDTSKWQSLSAGIQVPAPPMAGAVTGAGAVSTPSSTSASTPKVPAPPQNTSSGSVKPWSPYMDNGITGAANQMVRMNPDRGIEDSVVPAPPAPTGSTDNSYALNQAQIEAEAKARIDRMTADKERIANQTKAGLLTSYNRLRDSVNQDRSLQDVTDQRSLSPFSGRSDYAQGLKVLTRGKQDTQYADNYQTQVGNVDAQLNDWLNLAPEQQQQITDELTRLERDYGLQVGQLTGNFNGSRTLAGQAQDANYTGQYNGQQTLQAQQQAFAQQQQGWENRFNYGQATGQFGNGQTTLQKQQADAQNAQWQQQYDNSNSQWQQEYNQKQQYQNAQINNMNADNARLASTAATSSTKAKDPMSYVNELSNMYITKDDNGVPQVNNPYGLRMAIIGMGLDDQSTIQLLNYYGLPVQATNTTTGR